MDRLFQQITCLIVLALLNLGSARAEEQSERLRLAREVVVANETVKQLDSMLPLVMNSFKPLLTQGNQKAEQDFDQLGQLISRELEPYKSKFADDIARIFADRYTESELQDLIRFFKSPTGQKMIQNTPAMAQDTMAVGQEYGGEIAPKVMDRMKVELRKRGHRV